MIVSMRRLAVALAVLAIPSAGAARGTEPAVSLGEITHTADVIFVGTVARVEPWASLDGRMIFTDVTFERPSLVHARSGAAVVPGRELVLTFAGGQIGERAVSVSGVPRFEVGERWLVFALFDGRIYANPLVGGTQGLFRLTKDRVTGVEYPLTAGGAGVLGVVGGEVAASPIVAGIENGRATWRASSDRLVAPTPSRADLGASTLEPPATASLLTLSALLHEIETTLKNPPPSRRVLRLPAAPEEGSGDVDETTAAPKQGTEGGQPPTPASGSPGAAPPGGEAPGAAPEPSGPAAPEVDGFERDSVDSPTALLCYCGYHTRFLDMEEVPAAWSWFAHNESGMMIYNGFMDIYRSAPDDGTWGQNSVSEFGGFPTDAQLQQTWGFSWGTALALTTQTFSSTCGRIFESDVVFNPAYAWWQNFDDTFGHSDRILYRAVLMHELGHTWGMQRGSCVEDYSYSIVSVMHAYYSSLVEDAWGIHFWDAYAIRRIYGPQTAVIPRKDVGVESYYASSGLHNASTNALSYNVGDAITVSGLTVENMSNVPTPGVRVRLFLSTDREINEGDYPMGSFWSWDSFPEEHFWSGSLWTTVPNVPTGTYYVGILLTTDGAAWALDDFGLNNITYLPTPIQVSADCPDDPYEALGTNGTDDSCHGALLAAGPRQSHSHCDPDWVFFEAQPGTTYAIETNDLVGGADTLLELFDSDCTTRIAMDDDGAGALASRILWTAPAAGGLFDVRVTEFGGRYLPPGRGYTISLTPTIPFGDGFESGGTEAWAGRRP